MKNSVEKILGCLYPKKCPVCKDIISEDKWFCDNCLSSLEHSDYDDFCTTCGFENESCRCRNNEFHFVGAVSVYKNIGNAKTAYYRYKLGRWENMAVFFAKQCADTVKEVFSDIEFDGLVCVPTANRSFLKRGFDHNKVISKRISDLLGIKYYDNLLKCRHFRPMQHNSKFADRFKNVRGKYYTARSINAKRILLFDDIHTTGATLDECAKELLFAGADRVYCVSVLSTANKNQKGSNK